MLVLRNLTLPSPNRVFTPPGCRLEGGTTIGMLAMLLLAKPRPAQVPVLGVLTWLYCVQHISPMTQLAPWTWVRRVAVRGLVARQVWYVVSRDVGAAVTIESERASGSRWPLPRIFSLRKAVLLVPSVIDAILVELR